MPLHNKLPRKHVDPRIFQGTVLGKVLRAEGRTKREAEKRLRKMFADVGLPTILRTPAEGDGMGPAYLDRLDILGPLSKEQLG